MPFIPFCGCFLMQYLNRGCTRYFATKDTDQKVLQNRKSPEVRHLCVRLIAKVVLSYLLECPKNDKFPSPDSVSELPRAN